MAAPLSRWYYRPPFGISPIMTEASGLYQPHESGERAVILGVRDHGGAVVDIVAWFPERPGRWWLRHGVMSTLGEVEIERAAHFEVPLHLFGTPDAWLFNHAPGGRWPAACVIDWIGFNPASAFMGIPLILCEHDLLARRLRGAERHFARPLRIEVRHERAA